jgi:glycosyltransferase involved in cell wall biosynthesis
MKLMIINHSFQKPEFYKRWRELSRKYQDLDITLLAPEAWEWGKEKQLTYGTVDVVHGSIIEEPRFRIHLIDTKRDRMGEWSSKRLEPEILKIEPDIVYFIGGFTAAPLMEIYRIREKNHLLNMKVMSFSMRGSTPTLQTNVEKGGLNYLVRSLGKRIILGPRLRKSNKLCDAVFCHYPDAKQAFIMDGYKGPIYMQTQVGVDPDIFHPDHEARIRIRNKYQIGDAFLFGSASRFHYSKGLSEVIKALPKEGNWKYLMMGWGRDDEVEKIKSEIKGRGLEDRVILTGFISKWADMAEHWNALDCAVHTPLTTPHWEETFSLALVQAMITGLPVIGSSSGSVPYQIGPDGIIVPEGNVNALRDKMEEMIGAPEKCRAIGDRMKERAEKCFNIYHLNDCFYNTIMDVYNGKYDEKKIDMSTYLVDMGK